MFSGGTLPGLVTSISSNAWVEVTDLSTSFFLEDFCLESSPFLGLSQCGLWVLDPTSEAFNVDLGDFNTDADVDLGVDIGRATSTSVEEAKTRVDTTAGREVVSSESIGFKAFSNNDC